MIGTLPRSPLAHFTLSLYFILWQINLALRSAGSFQVQKHFACTADEGCNFTGSTVYSILCLVKFHVLTLENEGRLTGLNAYAWL